MESYIIGIGIVALVVIVFSIIMLILIKRPKCKVLDGASGNIVNDFMYEIKGTLVNKTTMNYQIVEIEYELYDSGNNLLCLGHVQTRDLPKKGKWEFEMNVPFANGRASDVASFKLSKIDIKK